LLGKGCATFWQGVALDHAGLLTLALDQPNLLATRDDERALVAIENRAGRDAVVDTAPRRFEQGDRIGKVNRDHRVILGGPVATIEVGRQPERRDGWLADEPARKAGAVAAIVQERPAAGSALVPPGRALLDVGQRAGPAARAGVGRAGRQRSQRAGAIFHLEQAADRAGVDELLHLADRRTP